MQLSEMRKAVVPVVVMAVLGGLAALGIAEEMTVGEAVSFAVTAILVWAIPNKK